MKTCDKAEAIHCKVAQKHKHVCWTEGHKAIDMEDDEYMGHGDDEDDGHGDDDGHPADDQMQAVSSLCYVSFPNLTRASRHLKYVSSVPIHDDDVDDDLDYWNCNVHPQYCNFQD